MCVCWVLCCCKGPLCCLQPPTCSRSSRAPTGAPRPIRTFDWADFICIPILESKICELATNREANTKATWCQVGPSRLANWLAGPAPWHQLVWPEPGPGRR